MVDVRVLVLDFGIHDYRRLLVKHIAQEKRNENIFRHVFVWGCLEIYSDVALGLKEHRCGVSHRQHADVIRISVYET